MSLVHFLLAILTVSLISLGQILYKYSTAKINFEKDGILIAFLSNPSFVFGIILSAIAVIPWFFVLKSMPLRLAYPFTAMSYIFVPFLSYFLLGEPIKIQTILGGVVIITGICVATF